MGSTHRLTAANISPKFNENLSKVQEIWSGQESVTEGQTDKGHFYNPPSASWQGINVSMQEREILPEG